MPPNNWSDTTMQVTSLQTKISNGKQDVTFTELLKVGSFKVRIKIRRDSYDFQSYAQAEIWSGISLQWNNIASIHYDNMLTASGVNNESFRKDRDNLIKEVKLILE